MEINKYTFKDENDNYSTENSEDIHKSFRNGEPFGYIDFNKATKPEIAAYYQGIVDEMVIERNFQKIDDKQDNQNNIVDMQNAFGNTQFSPMESGMGNSNQMRGPQKTLLPPGVKPQSYENSIQDNMAAFSDRLLIAMLGSFALGVIATAIYIFINLGKVTFTI